MQTTFEKNKRRAISISGTKVFEILIRFGVFATFLGHGILALIGKPEWIPLITAFGFSDATAAVMLPVIGGIDVIVAVAMLFHPVRALMFWTAFWAFMTALSRPLAGMPVLEFVERASNWILPIVLLWVKGFPSGWKDLWKYD